MEGDSWVPVGQLIDTDFGVCQSICTFVPFMWVAIFICQYYCSSLQLLVSLVWLHHPNGLLKCLITCLATLSFGLNFSHDCFMDDKVNSLWHLRGALIEVVFCKIQCVTYCWNDSRPILQHNNVIGLFWSCLLGCKQKILLGLLIVHQVIYW